MLNEQKLGDPVHNIEARLGRHAPGHVYQHQLSLVKLLNRVRRPGHMIHAAEIGVATGHTSAYLLEQVPDATLVMVDPWTPPAPDSDYVASGDSTARWSAEQFAEAMRLAKERTEFAAHRRVMLQMTSQEAAAYCGDGYDLVFLDGAHDYYSVAADIAAWYPKVRPGGILAGHDYDHPRFKGVALAVCEWVNCWNAKKKLRRNRIRVRKAGGRVWWVKMPEQGPAR